MKSHRLLLAQLSVEKLGDHRMERGQILLLFTESSRPQRRAGAHIPLFPPGVAAALGKRTR